VINSVLKPAMSCMTVLACKNSKGPLSLAVLDHFYK